jgi:asparagine synthase (glutamine-hydrolysing)
MIYLGLWNVRNVSRDISNKIHNLTLILKQYTSAEPSFIAKNNFTLVYGKPYPQQDMDQIWESDSTVLIGRIFDKERNTIVEPKEFKQYSQELKQDLTRKVWGKYVYWLLDNTNMLEVMVDPTGQLPCFYYTLPNGELLFASHIDLISQCLPSNLEYNWSYLCSYLFYGSSCAMQTPFKGLEEISPGCVLSATQSNQKIRSFWNPCSTIDIPSPVGNAVNVLQSVLKPMIDPYQNVCVSLSGGLDSSSLVYCLNEIKRSNQKLTAFNHFHSDVKSSNELHYARKVCEEVGIELIEVDISETLPFDTYCDDQDLKLNKPFPGCINIASINKWKNHLPTKDSCIFLSGQGSDHIFMRPPTQMSIADYLLTQGTQGLVRKIKEVTHFYRDALTPVLTQNAGGLIRYLFAQKLDKRGSRSPQGKLPHWLTKKVHQYKTSKFIHPVYWDLPSRILPGKYQQMNALYAGLASVHVNIYKQYPEQYPFLCEPMMKFAFSFATYDLFQKGYDRYPLRQAVSSHFHTHTVWRRDKGQTTGIIQLGVKKNIDYVMELCLEGELVRQGFIDPKKLHQTILLISNGDAKNLWPFIHLSSIEIFLKTWSQK